MATLATMKKYNLFLAKYIEQFEVFFMTNKVTSDKAMLIGCYTLYFLDI